MCGTGLPRLSVVITRPTNKILWPLALYDPFAKHRSSTGGSLDIFFSSEKHRAHGVL